MSKCEHETRLSKRDETRQHLDGIKQNNTQVKWNETLSISVVMINRMMFYFDEGLDLHIRLYRSWYTVS